MSLVAWYAARAGGIVAYVLLTFAVAAGISLAAKQKLPGFPRFAVTDVHRFLGILSGAFIAIHIAGLLADRFVPFTVLQVLVPGSAHYKPLATGLGTVAVELLLALGLTNRLQKRIGYKRWRKLHYASFAVWVLALGHGISAGSDRHALWLQAIYAGSVLLVGGLLSARLAQAKLPRWAVASPAFAACAVGLLLLSGGSHRSATQTAAVAATPPPQPRVVVVTVPGPFPVGSQPVTFTPQATGGETADGSG
jgi:predicted ferric reductase